MSGTLIAFAGFAGMLLLIAARMPVGLAMLFSGAVGYLHYQGWGPFFSYMKTNPYEQFANYTLSVIPLFILVEMPDFSAKAPIRINSGMTESV